jgi:Protein of unknown function (Hypoth_ymh)
MPNLATVFAEQKDLLALSPEELGGVIIEIAPSIVQNGMFGMDGLTSSLYPPQGNVGFPRGGSRPVVLALAEALSWLVTQGLLIRDPGQVGDWYIPTRRARDLKTRADVEAYRKGRVLPLGLLQPVLADKIWPLFLRGDHDIAVFQAFKEVEVRVRSAANAKGAGYADDLVGVKLMRAAFHPDNGPLRDKNLVPAEREGDASLFAGAILHAKNPNGHRDVNVEPQQAARLIAFASHLLDIVERRSV